MTIVEFFDTEPTENILAALRLGATRLVCLGFRQTMTDRRIRATRRFFAGRPNAPALRFLRVDDRDYAGVAAAIGDLLAQYDDCCFEMTGGSDLMLAAMGAVAAARPVPMFEMDVRTQSLRLIRAAQWPPALTAPLPETLTAISAQESVRLRGGTLYESAYRLSDGADKALRAAVTPLWSVFIQDPGLWNRQCNILASLCAQSRTGSLQVEAVSRTRPDPAHMARLSKQGLVRDYREEGQRVSFAFGSQQAKRCLTRAGDLLELRVFLAAAADPGFFTDAVMGAQIDWAGLSQHQSGEKSTVNEIDGLAMHGVVPLFVSCKNGDVHKEALYELDAVATRFGGRYAAKLLVATGLNGTEGSKQYLRRRAADMGITLAEDAKQLSEQALGRLLRDAVTNPPPGLPY